MSHGDLFDVGHRDISRLHLGKLERARTRPVFRRLEAHHDARKGGPELDHARSEPLPYAGVQTPTEDLAASRRDMLFDTFAFSAASQSRRQCV